MLIGQTATALHVDVAAGTAYALLVALSAACSEPRHELPRDLAAALDQVGDTDGEAWLNLLGIPLDAGPPFTTERLLDAVASLDAVELRRHLLGRYAWSWCTVAGIDDLESAAAGDRAAADRLLGRPRYYAGKAAASLGVLLTLDPDETKRRLVRALEAGTEHLVGGTTDTELEAAERDATTTLAGLTPLGAIERLAGGYRYVPEPEAERVVLIPHLEPGLPLVLAQHRSSRLIVYLARRDRSTEERLLMLGRALSDPNRLQILALVGGGVGGASDLVERTGLSRSTVHHHLAQLREAGFVALEGNARAYRYLPRRAAANEAAELVAGLIGREE
jgi:DNA-binding transcriptional ArsR family regulator